MGQLSRHEPGLFHRAIAAATEDRGVLSTGGLAATGIDVHRQLEDFAAGERGAAVHFSALADRDGFGSRQC